MQFRKWSVLKSCFAHQCKHNHSPISSWRLFSREQAKSECDWVVMLSVIVASQPSCFFLCSREQIRLVENIVKTMGEL